MLIDMIHLFQSSRNHKLAKSDLRMVFKKFLESFQLSDFNEMQSKNNLSFYLGLHICIFG